MKRVVLIGFGPLVGLAGTLVVACWDERDPVTPDSLIPFATSEIQVISCRADARSLVLKCDTESEDPRHAVAFSGSVVLGGQGLYVRLTSENVSYNGTDTFQADVTVQNLIGQALGTTDGTTLDPEGVRVFFHSGPTVTSGTGTVTVGNPTGIGTFTQSQQPYFQYDELLGPQATSSPVTWEWSVPNTVATFQFSVFVTAGVHYPDGWVEVTPQEAVIDISQTVDLSSTVRDMIGRELTGIEVTWASGSESIVTVEPFSGEVTGQSHGTAIITASSPGPQAPGEAVINVAAIETIGPAGGVVTVSDGASIDFRPSSFSEDAAVQIVVEDFTASIGLRRLSASAYTLRYPLEALADGGGVVLTVPAESEVVAGETPYFHLTWSESELPELWLKLEQDGASGSYVGSIRSDDLRSYADLVGSPVFATFNVEALPPDVPPPVASATVMTTDQPPFGALPREDVVKCNEYPIDWDPASAPTGDYAIVLVHGWSSLVSSCPSFEKEGEFLEYRWGFDYFKELLPAIRAEFGATPIWVFSYPSHRDFSYTGEQLAARLKELSGIYDGVFVVAHSMGGLVARSAADEHFQTKGVPSDFIRGLITLGTPHVGTEAGAAGWAATLEWLGTWWLWFDGVDTEGRESLLSCNAVPAGKKCHFPEDFGFGNIGSVHAFAGDISIRQLTDETLGLSEGLGYTSLCELQSKYPERNLCWNDMVVPVQSALAIPPEFATNTIVTDYVHDELHRGDDRDGTSGAPDPIYDEIFAALCTMLASVEPNAPSNLVATVVSASQIDLEWQHVGDNEDGFYIERCVGEAPGCTFSRIKTLGPNITTHEDTGLAEGTSYTYRVQAFNTAGGSGYSAAASVRTRITIAGRITFVNFPDGSDGEIEVMNSDGSVTRLTDNPAGAISPSWSPDGTRIVFSSRRDGPSSDIYVMNADGSGLPERLTDHPASDHRPAWSPDGSKIAFASDRDGSPEIYVMNAADGLGLTRLTSHPAVDAGPDWSPDGARLVFESNRDGNYEIYAMNSADGLGLTNLTSHPAGDYYPSWSPDGTRIVFSSRRDGPSSDIYVMNADGSGVPVRLGVSGGVFPNWCLNGTMIVYTAQGSGDELHLIRPDGTGDTPVGVIGYEPACSR